MENNNVDGPGELIGTETRDVKKRWQTPTVKDLGVDEAQGKQ